MNQFEEEQAQLLKLSDEIRNDRTINKRRKNQLYIDIVKKFLEEHMLNNFRFEKNVKINDIKGRFHLIMVQKKAMPIIKGKTEPEQIVAAIEIRGSGLVAPRQELEGQAEEKSSRFNQLKKKNAYIKCLYLTLQEREKTRKGANYVKISRNSLGKSFFALRESTTQEIILGEWKRFVETLADI